MTKDEALKLALDALEILHDENMDYLTRNKLGGENNQCMVFARETITAIKEALAQPEKEPVAWGVFEGNLHDMFFSPSEAQEMADLKGTHAEVRPLYTTPPQREFVGLTYEEKREIRYSHMTSAEFIDFIEAKLKEKNMNNLFKPHQCPRCFGLFKVGDRFWNDSGTVYHWVCWVNKSKENT